jgi:hypothetical protein
MGRFWHKRSGKTSVETAGAATCGPAYTLGQGSAHAAAPFVVAKSHSGSLHPPKAAQRRACWRIALGFGMGV